MRISKNFKTIRDFQLIKNRRKCWLSCFLCNCNLTKENTEHVHMIITEKSETKFICDNCEHENNTTEV